MRDSDERDDDGRERDEPLTTLTMLAERRTAVATNAEHLRRLLAALQDGRAVPPDVATWFVDAALRYARSGAPLDRELGLRSVRGAHQSGHVLLRVLADESDE